MAQTRAGRLVGRKTDRARLRARIAALQTRAGGTILLRGDAGIGKSRLLHDLGDAASSNGYLVLEGRATDPKVSTPLRPVVEVLIGAWNAGCALATPELVQFRSVLGPLVPGGGTAPPAESPSTLVLAEGVRRVLAELTAARPVVVLLEDLHWADADSVEVVGYLADHLADLPLLLVATLRTRTGGVTAGALERLALADDIGVVDVPPLDGDEVREMVDLLVADGPAPPHLAEFVVAHADGVPLFVEELVAGALAARSAGAEPWAVGHALNLSVPAGFAGSVRERVAGLVRPGPDVLRAASLAGREIDVELLGVALDLGVEDVVGAVQEADEAGLVERTGPSAAPPADAGGVLHFRHALTREAIRGGLLVHERRRFAASLADAIRVLHPRLDGAWCTLAARLRREAGDAHEAATLLLEGARRASETGMLGSALALLEEASSCAGRDLVLLAAIQDLQLDVLALQGRYDTVLVHVRQQLRTIGALGGPAVGVARVHLRAARAAVLAEHWARAVEELDATDAALRDGHAHVACEAALLRAHVDIAVGEMPSALARAELALRRAQDLSIPELQCEALEIIGRVHRASDLAAAAEAFERGLAVATAHDLRLWHARALHEVGTVEAFRTCSTRSFEQALEVARTIGAPRLACTIDTHLASAHITRFEPELALPYAERSVRDARALGVAPGFTTAQLAIVHALLDDPDAMARHARDAAQLSGDDPVIRAVVLGMGTGMWSLLTERRHEAYRRLDDAMDLANQTSGVPPGMFHPIWALLRSLDGAGGPQAVAEAADPGVVAVRVNEGLLAYAAAVVTGSAGDGDAAVAHWDRAEALFALLESSEGWRHLGRRLAAEGAVRDGWGMPASWLPETVAFWQASRFPAIAAATAELLRRASGARRRGRGDSEVPDALQAFGVTSREVDVLRWVAAGLSNKQVGAVLHLSPRTVGSHVSHLLAKLGLQRRAQLAAAAVDAGLDVPPARHANSVM